MNVAQIGELHQQLLRMFSDGRLHSGNALAEQFGVSRASIWNAVRVLQQLGLEIRAVPGTGYRLDQPLELLDAAAIESRLSLGVRALLQSLHIHTALPSTNAFLLNRSSAERFPFGTVCLAEMQTAGRGRLGRSWQSPLAGNVYLSLLWHFSNASVLGGLSLAAGAVLVRALRALGVPDLALKWPNDILWQERKLGGVLLELSGEVHGRCAVVVGIGLNVRVPQDYAAEIDQAFSELRQIPGLRLPSRNVLVAAMLNELLPMLAGFEQQGFAAYRDEWNACHAFQGRAVVLDLGAQQVDGVIAGVSETGTLLVDCDEGGRREFASGDVRLRVAKR